MKASLSHISVIGNILLVILGVAWAYVSYRNNMLNVGGGTGSVDFWYHSSSVAYGFIALWAGVLLALLIVGFVRRCRPLSIAGHFLATLLVAPTTLFFVHWVLHRGFPVSPV
jgi:hypothetical protein